MLKASVWLRLLAPVWGLAVTCGAVLLGLLFKPLIRTADGVLAPGALLPEWYWGGLHDPFVLLVGLLLNIAFYSVVAFGVGAFLAWAVRRRP